MIQLKNIIVHKIIKGEGLDSSLQLSKKEIPIDDRAKDLVFQLDDSYIRTNQKDYAIFRNSSDEKFPQNFAKLINENINFLEFSREATSQLREGIKSIHMAKGGYLVYAFYEKDSISYFSIFLIRDTRGLIFKHDDASESFTLDSTIHLDLDKLAMACKINLNRYNMNDGKYISLIKKRQSDISVYFTKWIAVDQRTNNKTYTKTLYELTAQIEMPPDENGNRMGREEFRRRLFEYISTPVSKTVNLFTISQTFFPEEIFGENYLAKFIEENDITISTEFSADPTELKRFVEISFQADGIKFGFSKGDFGEGNKVYFHPDDRNMVVVNSVRFAEKLRKEIAE